MVINHKLLNDLGEQIAEVRIKRKNLGTMVIRYKSQYYRPLHYDLHSRTACCVPVEVIDTGEEIEVTSGTKDKRNVFLEKIAKGSNGV